MTDDSVRFTYKNYRGEIRRRHATPISFRFDSTEYHPEPQWIMKAFDHDKQAVRDFALVDCRFRRQE